MKIGSLFSGYGGLEEGVRSVIGGELAWVSDIDKGACKVLAHRYPDVPNLGDIMAVDWTQVEPVDVICGGSPCQDVSHAGKRAGMTEGTRSNLWVAMREAIATLRPSLVIWENVGGAYSAAADSEMESREGRLGDRPGRPALRALGRVLGDLASLGYVGGWHGLRAADVGAPHGRLRVFVVAHAAGYPWRPLDGDGGTAADADGGLDGTRSPWADQRPVPHGDGRGAESNRLLPSPRTSDTNGAGQHGDGGLDLRTAVTMLPATSAEGGGEFVENGVAGSVLPAVNSNEGAEVLDGFGAEVQVHGSSVTPIFAADLTPESKDFPLLPTPAVNDMGRAYTPETWDAWTAEQRAKHGNGNGHGKSLEIEAQRLLPTPKATNNENRQNLDQYGMNLGQALGITPLDMETADASATEARPGEVLRGLRDADVSQEVRSEARGPDSVPESEDLLTSLREHASRGHQERPSSAGEETPQVGVRDVRGDEPAARSPRGPKLGERRPDEPADPVRFLSPETALAGGQGSACGCNPGGCPWGEYGAAVHRWEHVLGRVAPQPTVLSVKGNPQLSPMFTEFLMGLPAGWITDVPGVTRNEALKLCGNGVVWQQAAAAIRFLLPLIAELAGAA